MNRLQACILSAFLAFGAVTVQGEARAASPAPSSAPVGVMLPDFADLVDKYGPAVVNINTETRMQARQQIPGLSEDDPFYEFFKRFMPPEGPQGKSPKGAPAPKGPLRPFGLGSGFIVTPDGYIVTNAHVVENADQVKVRLTDKRELIAKVVGVDTRSDVAVIKVEATSLPTVKIGDSNKLRTGEWVIAIGSPYGFANTVTAGIVSATSRDNLANDPNMDAVPFIQTDVAVNPGNSGGPLLNMRGEVVGINSQIFSRTGAFAGISFAIPIDYAYGVAEQLMKSGHVTRGRIGVGITNVTRDLADSLGLAKAQGAAVGTVEEGSPAAKGGVQPGDVILKVEGRAVDGSADLSRTIRAIKPGTKVHLTVWRNGKTHDVTLTVVEFKDEEAGAAVPTSTAVPAPKPGKLGLAVVEIPDDQKKALKLPGGVAVQAVEGAAQAAGIQQGDVILRVNNTDVPNVKAFNEALAKLAPGKTVALLVRDENGTRFAIVHPEAE
ncbi:MAG TPA: DegQ family serine endoprotease [Usitatibacter sp.]|nr:DegQ family serine endoprotease [Usitatibacter sp.]